MSGGKFNYKDLELSDEIFGWDSERRDRDPFEDKEISEMVWDMLNLIHEFDWYASGDTSEDDYLAAKDKFKKKWFHTTPDERVRRVIDEVLEEARSELTKTFTNHKEEK